MDWHIIRASITLVSATLHVKRLFLAIVAISFFWTMGAVLAAQFPPLVKNGLGADQKVATLFLAVFSIGVAIGSVADQPAAQGPVSARYSPGLGAGHGAVRARPLPPRPELAGATAASCTTSASSSLMPNSWMVVVDLLGVAVAGGMFVVPLYAFLTTTVPKSETARTIAANNIVNSGHDGRRRP